MPLRICHHDNGYLRCISPMKQLLANSILVVAVTVFSLLAAEGLVRGSNLFPHEREVATSAATFPSAPTAKAPNALLHPYLGWIMRPDASVSIDRAQLERIFPEGVPQVWLRELPKYNAFGLLSDINDFRDLGKDDYRVGVFGGSVANGMAFLGAHQIEKDLAPLVRKRVRVLNFASPGYKQPQQLIAYMQSLLLGIQLDLVINFDGFNEVVLGNQDAAEGFHPLFPSRSHWGEVVQLSGTHWTRESMEMTAAVFERKEAAAGLQDMARSGLAVSELAKSVIGLLLERNQVQQVRLEKALQESVRSDEDAGVADLPDPCLAMAQGCNTKIVEYWVEASILMDAIARRSGALYIHVLQPNQYVPGSKPLTAEERRHAWDPDHPWSKLARQGYPFLQQAGRRLRENGVDFHDITGLFAQSHQTVYMDTCCHLNQAGNEWIARAIAGLAARAIAAAAESGSRVKQGRVAPVSKARNVADEPTM